MSSGVVGSANVCSVSSSSNEIGLVENDALSQNESTQAGKKVFIRYALAGETVQAKLTKSHKRFDEAEMVELLSAPSKDRIQPSCKHFGQCGGCALQHLDVEAQLAHKQQVLASHLKHFAIEQGVRCTSCTDLDSAISQALLKAGTKDIAMITGSLYLASAAEKIIKK